MLSASRSISSIAVDLKVVSSLKFWPIVDWNCRNSWDKRSMSENRETSREFDPWDEKSDESPENLEIE